MPANSILKRTIFMERRKPEDPLRVSDWALVLTTLGTMVEPRTTLFERKMPNAGLSSLDFSEDMTRIDRIEMIDFGKEKLLLSGGDYALHGGPLSPRIGR